MTNEELKKAVANLINQKGRHNTEVAYKRLVEVFNALADETQEKPHPTCDEACMYACSEAGTVLFKCDTPATSEVSWEESLRISDLPTIAECLENFSQDPTEDNAVCLVRDIMQLCRADQPKPIINNALADVTDIDVGDIPQNHIASVGNMVESAPTEAQTEGAVRVCPDLDRVCGDYLKGWCATCPKRNLHARNIRVTGFDNQESTPTETERQQFEAWFISEDAQKAASKQARGQVREWAPIETAPETGQFLVYMPTDKSQPIQVAKWHPNVKVIGGSFAFDCEKPTHWIPLPAAPKE